MQELARRMVDPPGTLRVLMHSLAFGAGGITANAILSGVTYTNGCGRFPATRRSWKLLASEIPILT